MGTSKITLVEDDEVIGKSLTQALQAQGYAVDWARTGSAGVELVGGRTDLVILDLGLPDTSGLDVCRQIRTAVPTTQILMLTARREEVDVVLGLDAGADDYLTKPFRLAELLARVRARLRQGDETSGVQIVGDLSINRAERRVYLRELEVDLRPKEFDLLALLAANAGNVVTREQVMADVWDENWYGSTKTLDMHIRALRAKLDQPGAASHISTLRGVGYRLERGAPVKNDGAG